MNSAYKINNFININFYIILIFTIFFLFCKIEKPFAQSISGIEIGANINTTKNIGSLPIAKEQSGPVDIYKWELADSNYLSVTSYRNTGEILFIELDWSGSTSGMMTDFPSILFGKTLKKDIANKLGSLGFYYRARGMSAIVQNSSVVFNSYEVSNKNTIVTFVSTVKIAKGMNEENIGDYMYLTSIIIASKDYLDILWGDKKIYAPDYKPVFLNLLQPYTINTLQYNSKNNSSACQRFPNLCQ